MLRRNWFTTLGGIMAGFAAIPPAIGTYARYANHNLVMPDWLYLVCIFLGILGPVVIGVGAKGQDEPDTPPSQIGYPVQGVKNATINPGNLSQQAGKDPGNVS